MEPLLPEIHAHLRASRLQGGVALSHSASMCKQYSRMPQIALAPPLPLSMTLSEALEKRTSSMKKELARPSVSSLGQLLGHAAKVTPRGRRPYPSGGAFYPIEIYLLALEVDVLARGVYHYRPDTHALESLWDIDESVTPQTIAPQASERASAFLALTATCEKSRRKYNDFAYALALFEAGHIMQNMQLVAAALALNARPLGGFNDETVRHALTLDDGEHPLYLCTL